MRENNTTENNKKKLIVRDLHWGTDGGGMACGPVEGSSLVELCVTYNGRNYFIGDSAMMEFEYIYVSPLPLFDVLKHMTHWDVNTEEEYNKVTETSIFACECEMEEDLEDMEETEFREAIAFVRYVLQVYLESELAEDEEYETAQKFIEKYVGEDICQVEIPEEAEAADPVDEE